MRTKQSKSPCCNAKDIHYGKKRRQCSQCKKIRTLRPKKRGRKRKRFNVSLLKRQLQNHYTLRQTMALWDQRSYFSLRHETRQAIQAYVNQPREYSLPEKGDLILLMDGKWFRFHKQTWVLYLMALRPVTGSQAVLMDPVLLPGKEYAYQWRKVLKTLPDSLKPRVCALVSDGFRGANSLARQHGWVYQRCQFHLLRELLRRLGLKRKATFPLRNQIKQTVQDVLVPSSEDSLARALKQLHYYAEQKELASRFRRVLREFFRALPYFHTFRRYPQYHLPTTNNTMESYSSLLAKHVCLIRSPKALLLWATAYIRMNPTITCNGKENQQN